MTKGLEIIKAKRPTTKWTLFKPSFTMVIFTTYLLPTSSFAVDEDDEDGDDDDDDLHDISVPLSARWARATIEEADEESVLIISKLICNVRNVYIFTL